MTLNFDQLAARAQVVGRIPSPESARRWLRAVASTLADWGGKDAAEVLRATLPSSSLSGPGSSGRSLARVLRQEGPGSERVALHLEAGQRAGEPDPGKVAVALRPLLGLVKEQLDESQLARLVAALPPTVGRELADATTGAPYAYHLLPQSYARPEHEPPST